MIIKILNSKFVIRNCNKGMSYVELIVAISIFGIMSSVVLFNFRTFEDRVEIKNLGNEVGLKIVQAQKDSSSGKLGGNTFSDKPSYGIYFDKSTVDKSKTFIYFADINNNSLYDGEDSILDTINITRGNYISDLLAGGSSSKLSVVFTRSTSGVTFSTDGASILGVSNVSIVLSSISGSTSTIKVYSSGRIQIN